MKLRLTGHAECGFLGLGDGTHLKERTAALDKDRIILTVEERARWEHMLSSGQAAARRLTHARVRLLADEWHGEACSDAAIISALGTGVRTLARLRKRCVTEGFAAALDHRPQPPRPDTVKVTGTVEQTWVELACADPPRG
jgi:hypothetical protein